MYKDVLRAIENIEYLPAIGIVIFMIFFLVWLWQVLVMDKKEVSQMENLPFEDSFSTTAGSEEISNTSNSTTHATTTS